MTAGAVPAGYPVLRRSIASALLLVSAAAAISCSDALAGGRRSATIVLQPLFSARDAAIYRALGGFNLSVTSVRITLVRPTTPPQTLADTTVSMAPGQDSIAVPIKVAINGSQEKLTASMEMRSGTVLLFTGKVDVLATVGADPTAAPPVIVPVWVGPGKEATRIVISPRDRTLGATNGRVTFSAVAYDATQTPVTDAEYISRWKWKVNDPTLGSIPVEGGDFVTTGKTGVAIVTVFTPNLLTDTVRLTLAPQGPMAKVRYARQLERLNAGGTSTVPVTASDANGTTIPSATFTYTSRTPAAATVASSGAISGVAGGQSVIVAASSDPGSTTIFQDSLLAIVADPAGPVLLSSLDRFDYRLDTTMTVSIFVDMTNTTSKLGSTTIDVTWNPAQLIYVTHANGASGASPTVNSTNAAAGHLTLALADVAGFAGNVELLRITFKTSTTAATGSLALAAREMTAADAAYTNLLPKLVQVTHPLSVH